MTFQQREFATISALATIPGVESQLQAHIGMGLNTGITETQLKQVFNLIGKSIGKKDGDLANDVLEKVVFAREETKIIINNLNIG